MQTATGSVSMIVTEIVITAITPPLTGIDTSASVTLPIEKSATMIATTTFTEFPIILRDGSMAAKLAGVIAMFRPDR
jgi:hypothetical protein